MVTRLVTSRSSLLVVACGLALLAGCEPEIGSPCSDNEEEVNDLVPQVGGTNNLVQDVKLENCSQGFCLSFQGSRPFCTKRCEADIECAEAGSTFFVDDNANGTLDPGEACSDDVIGFGPLACLDYEDPLLPQPDTTPSGEACEVDGDCTVGGESCFPAGELVGTCGTAGRDCLTGPNGGRSETPKRYCVASPDVIAARDEEFGRTQ